MALNDHTLGKSMSKVFAKTTRRETSGGRGHLEVDINLVVPPQNNPRKEFNEEHLRELVKSIEHHGIIQPLIVMKREGGFEIIAGERRYRAARMAGLARVPVVIHDEVNDEQLAELRLIENIQREDLNPIELADAYRHLLDDHGLTQDQLAERVGKDRSSISNCLRLLTLVPVVQRMVVESTLSMGHARALCGIDDHAKQQQIAERAAKEGLSVRAIEHLIREDPSIPRPTTTRASRQKPPHIRELEGNLYRLFGNPVQIVERDGKGSLTINFSSKGSFKAIIDILDTAFRQSQVTDPDESA
jgi:ParB family transcriptional regulator, chromosome partitioning protein